MKQTHILYLLNRGRNKYHIIHVYEYSFTSLFGHTSWERY